MQNIITNYKLINKIGHGSYGEVWKASHINTNKLVAIKLERKNKSTSTLKYETIILRHLRELSRVVNIKYYGEINDYNYLIMDLLESNINSYYNSKLRIVDTEYHKLKEIGIQMMECISDIHNKGIVHRDIKPSNFMLDSKNIVCLIDFGLAKQYITPNGHHRQNSKCNRVVGTIRYTSLYVHRGNTYSRRDDIISFVYVIIYLLRGTLPWQGINFDNKHQKVDKVYNLKNNILICELCKFLPNKIEELLTYAYSLSYYDEPNYDYIIFLLKTIT